MSIEQYIKERIEFLEGLKTRTSLKISTSIAIVELQAVLSKIEKLGTK